MGVVKSNYRLVTCFASSCDSFYTNLPITSLEQIRAPVYQINIYFSLTAGVMAGYFFNSITNLFILWSISAFVALAIMMLFFSESDKTSYENSRINYNISKILFLLIFFIIGYGRYCYILQSENVYLFVGDNKQIRIIGVAEKIIPKSGGRWQIELVIEKIYDKNGNEIEIDPKSKARIRLSTRKLYEEIYPGDKIGGVANIFSLPSPVIPGGHDFARDLWFEGISGIGYFTYGPHFIGFSSLSEGIFHSADIFFSKLRQDLYKIVSVHFDEKRISGFVYALLSGISGGIDADTLTDLRSSGLSHILAVSGFHMAIVMGGLFWFLRLAASFFINFSLVYPVKKLAAVNAIIFGLFYLILADFAVSASRAWIMTSIMFFAILLDKRAFQLHNIVLAGFVIIFLWPQSLFQPGFQMSFLIVLSIIYGHELGVFKRVLSSNGLEIRGSFLPFLSNFWNYFRVLFLISSIASLVALPIILLHFKTLSTLSVIANIIVIPCLSFIVMPALVLGIPLLYLGLPFADVLLFVASLGLDFILSVASYINSFSYSSISYFDIDNFWLYVAMFSTIGFCFSSFLYHRFYILLFVSSFLIAITVIPSYSRLLISPEEKILAFRSKSGFYCSFGNNNANKFLTRNWKDYLDTMDSEVNRDCDFKIVDGFCYVSLEKVKLSFRIDPSFSDNCYPFEIKNMFSLKYSFIDKDTDIDKDEISKIFWHQTFFSTQRGSIRLSFSSNRDLEISFVDEGNLFLGYSSSNFYPWRPLPKK